MQEEVGLRGAKVANKIKPDLAIAVDVAVAYDTPGMNNLGSETTLGNGPVVILMDASNVAHQGLRQHIKEVARRHYITVQWDTTVVQMQEVSMLQMKVYLQFLLALPYVICIQMCQYSTQMIMKIQYAL